MKFRWKRVVFRIRVKGPKKLLGHLRVKDYRENKEAARGRALARLSHFNQFYNLKVGKVFIRNQKSRWGSCSSKGNLNFNYKIAMLPSELSDYIIVHELCHLAQMNHSKNFWSLVEQQIPNYKNLRAELKKY